SLVKRKLIAVNGAQIFRKSRIQQSVGGFVRDNVVGKAGENQTARQLRSLSSGDSRKITKEQRLFRGAVIGVRSAKRMRIDAQLANETIPLPGRLLFVAKCPENASSQRLLEIADRSHHHRAPVAIALTARRGRVPQLGMNFCGRAFWAAGSRLQTG